MDQKQKELYYKLMTDCKALIPECPNEKAGKRVLACEYCRCDYLVKHTAKEILDEVKFLIEERNCVGGYDLEDENIDGIIFVEVLNEIKERYGVGVE